MGHESRVDGPGVPINGKQYHIWILAAGIMGQSSGDGAAGENGEGDEGRFGRWSWRIRQRWRGDRGLFEEVPACLSIRALPTNHRISYAGILDPKLKTFKEQVEKGTTMFGM